MTKLEGGSNPNTIPTHDDVIRETLFLDAYGIEASKLVADYPVNLDKFINKQPILDHLIDKMAEHDWEFAGSGFFSAVFIKGGLALKLGFKVSDTGAMYAAWCRSHRGLPGVPEVYSLTKFSGCYVVLTRRYESIDEEWLDPKAPHYIAEMAEEFGCIKGAVNIGERIGVNRFASVRTAVAIREFFEDITDFDLHASNVMIDQQTGELIITDPISHGPCSGGTGSSYYYYSTENTLVA